MNTKKWLSAQSIIIIAILIIIFSYIGLDAMKTKPEMRSELDSIKTDYMELSEFLEEKIPDIDSTLKIQASQISSQSIDIDSLNSRVNSLAQAD